MDYLKGITLDVNLVVYTEEEFKRMKENSNLFLLEIEKGDVL